jgi:hypothetical protein
LTPGHHFKEIEKHMSDLKELTGPVYNIDSHHSYNEIVKKVNELKDLTGPVYNVDQVSAS